MIYSGRSAHEGSGRNIGSDAALRSHDRIVAHCAMTDNTDLSGQYDPISDFGGPRQPDLRAKQSVLADVRAMTYLYEIVYLYSTSNVSPANAGTINTGIGLHFHIVFDHDRRRLWDFVPSALGSLGEAKAISADYNAVLQQDVVSDPAFFPHNRVGVSKEVIPNLNVTIDHDVGR